MDKSMTAVRFFLMIRDKVYTYKKYEQDQNKKHLY